jgi:hypothetical protein
VALFFDSINSSMTAKRRKRRTSRRFIVSAAIASEQTARAMISNAHEARNPNDRFISCSQ